VPGERQEYRKMDVEVAGCLLHVLWGGGDGEALDGVMRHGDEVVRLPEGFEVVARSVQGAVAAIENREKCWALIPPRGSNRCV
jgi:GMP synthase (glutamine-hydrolysing)